MKIEIEFRGCRFNEWVYGDLETRRASGRTFIHTYNEDGTYNKQYEVDPQSVGQFSGLHDKNGKKIYEGDIVRWERDNRLHCVKFWKGMFYASVQECNSGIYGGFPLWTLCEEEQHCTIVGNIYDNLELIKEGKQ